LRLVAQVEIKSGLDADVTLTMPNHPTDTSKGERKLILTKVWRVPPPSFSPIKVPRAPQP
jgi:hypothetical protein